MDQQDEFKAEFRKQFQKKCSFDPNELTFAFEWIVQSQKKGRKVQFHIPDETKQLGSEIKTLASFWATSNGITPSDKVARVYAAAVGGGIIIDAPELKAYFVFIKEMAGRGIFGMRYRYHTRIAYDDGRYEEGPTFKRFSLALTSIGNVYRGVGLR